MPATVGRGSGIVSPAAQHERVDVFHRDVQLRAMNARIRAESRTPAIR
jgi:hypothetical protein